MAGSKTILSLALCTIFAAHSLAALPSQQGTDAKPSFNWDRIKYVHAFGDSYSFVQGTLGQANFRQAFEATVFRLSLVFIVVV
jgi:hypothetical protein